MEHKTSFLELSFIIFIITCEDRVIEFEVRPIFRFTPKDEFLQNWVLQLQINVIFLTRCTDIRFIFTELGKSMSCDFFVLKSLLSEENFLGSIPCPFVGIFSSRELLHGMYGESVSVFQSPLLISFLSFNYIGGEEALTMSSYVYVRICGLEQLPPL